MTINGQAGRRWSGSLGPVWLVACFVCLAGITLAAEPSASRSAIETLPYFAGPQPVLGFGDARTAGFSAPQHVRLEPAARTDTPGFLERHLVPRMTKQLGRVAALHTLESERVHFEGSRMHDWFSGTTGDRAVRGARQAVRAYVFEETAVGSLVESLRVGSHGFGRPVEGQAIDYGVELVHGVPHVEMRHRSGSGSARFGVGLDGALSFEFRPTQANARVRAGYDARRSSFSLAFRHGF